MARNKISFLRICAYAVFVFIVVRTVFFFPESAHKMKSFIEMTIPDSISTGEDVSLDSLTPRTKLGYKKIVNRFKEDEPQIWWNVPRLPRLNGSSGSGTVGGRSSEDQYLCICSQTAVRASQMAIGPHAAMIPNTNVTLMRACLNDGSLERHRYMCAYFKEFRLMAYLKRLTHSSSRSGKVQPIRVLHNAPEYAVAKGLSFLHRPFIDYVGFDFSVGPLVFNAGLNEFKFDLANIPFPDNYFHMVITSHVLEHVPNVARCLDELYRVLVPGGVGFIAAPVSIEIGITIEDDPLNPLSEKEREIKWGQKDHLRIFGRDFPNIIKKAGFFIDSNRTNHPNNFFQRTHVLKAMKAFEYKNLEFRSFFKDDGLFFVYKTGNIIPAYFQK